MYGRTIIKELKKKYSFRLVGGVEMISQGRDDAWPGSGWRTQKVRQQLVEWAVPHLCADKPGRTTWERDRPRNPGF